MHRQHLVADVEVKVLYRVPDGLTFDFFNIAELNEHYSRGMTFRPSNVRLSDCGIGVIVDAGQTRIDLNAISERDLIVRIFSVFGVTAAVSNAGLVATRLIRQMGGLQGCRVFKIRGVRHLIKKHGPLDSFTRGEATQLIGEIDPHTNQPNFGDYEELHIEQRNSTRLSPADTFTFLLRREVLRVGLELTCPSCQLRFWRQLGAIDLKTECELCGDAFNVTTQLKDRDWRYRRSGLFGKNDNQHGAIPVALALQQLDANLSYDQMIATPSWNLRWDKEGACETDLVLIAQRPDGTVDIAVGECKAAGDISEVDVANLTTVADRLDAKGVTPFVIFAKTVDFRVEEIDLCRRAQGRYRHRVILLGPRELEPYHITERTREVYEIEDYDSSLDELASATDRVYFNPRLRPSPAVTDAQT